VTPESLGAEMDLEPGDRIIKVNGRVVRDYIDSVFIPPEKPNCSSKNEKTGEDWELELERAEDEDFGFSLDQIVPRQCANECLFCFCKGNPTDARPSLFVRDEDIGFVSLRQLHDATSITEDELQRIIEQRLTPHTFLFTATDLMCAPTCWESNKERADIGRKTEALA